MTQHFAGSRRDPSLSMADLQDALDLLRWEGEGGALDPHRRHARASREEARSAAFRSSRMRNPLPTT